MWEGVGDRTKTATYWPHNSSGYHSLSFPFSWTAQPGAWGPSLCWDMVHIPASSLQLIWTSCRQGHITIWRPSTSCERHNLHSIQPLDSQGLPLISLTRCTCYLHWCISFFDSLAGVNMQQLEFELAYYDSTIHCFNYYTMRTSPIYLIWFGLVSLFNGISTFVGYLMPNLFS